MKRAIQMVLKLVQTRYKSRNK